MAQPTKDQRCVGCDGATTERVEPQTFTYGGTVELTCDVPVIRCSACGSAYTDERAEAIRQRTVDCHLGSFRQKGSFA